MILPDVNILIAAYRHDHVHHAIARTFLRKLHDEGQEVALCDVTLSGFLRVVTHKRILSPPSTLDHAFAFIDKLLGWPTCVRIAPERNHWIVFETLCRGHDVTGAMVTDAYLAALAMEHGCAIATFDKDFDRFPGLRRVRPGAK